jgi:DNA-binding LacI/PurR family transcriptional regulator
MRKKLVPNEPTLADVATAAGLSTAAASLALRGKAGVSDATRERVMETARRLGYSPSARSARQPRKPRTIGLFVKSVQGGSPETDRFYAPVMAGIEEGCRALRLNLMFSTLQVDQQYFPREIPRLVTDHTCDGLVVVGIQFSEAAAAVFRTAPPAVLVDGYSQDGGFDSVTVDNIGGASVAVEHLIALGRRNIAILGTEPQVFPSILERRVGYERAVAASGLASHYIDAPYLHPDIAAEAGVAYVRAHPEVDAVFCSNDAVALAFLRAARESGISVPERLSVVGFDNIEASSFVSPALTTMDVDKVGMGRIAVNVLLHRLEFQDECITQTLIRPTLVERQSTSAVDSPVERALP